MPRLRRTKSRSVVLHHSFVGFVRFLNSKGRYSPMTEPGMLALESSCEDSSFISRYPLLEGHNSMTCSNTNLPLDVQVTRYPDSPAFILHEPTAKMSRFLML